VNERVITSYDVDYVYGALKDNAGNIISQCRNAIDS